MRPVLVALLVLGAACSRKSADSAPDAAGAAAALPPSLEFEERQANILYTFVDASGGVRSVDALADVPPERRQNVMVVDLSRSPEERMADRYVYFADLTVKTPEGKLKAHAVSRYKAPPLAAPLPGDAPAQDGSTVTVYSASWCGFCKKTMAFLRARNVPFKERDVERDPGAEQEMQAKAKRAGVRVSGVPVTDFMGELVLGFDQPKLEQLIARHGR